MSSFVTLRPEVPRTVGCLVSGGRSAWERSVRVRGGSQEYCNVVKNAFLFYFQGQDSWEIQESLFSNIVDLSRRKAVNVMLNRRRKPKLNHRCHIIKHFGNFNHKGFYLYRKVHQPCHLGQEPMDFSQEPCSETTGEEGQDNPHPHQLLHQQPQRDH